MKKSLCVWTLITALCAVCATACQTDLHVEDRAFECDAPEDCLAGFECVPAGGASTQMQCVRAGSLADASDGSSSDVAPSDAQVDAVSDTAIADIGLDATDTLDASECSSNQACPEGQCVDGACVTGCTQNDECPSTSCSESICMCKSGDCVPATFSSIRISDTTAGPTAPQCSNEDPGVDIFAARLIDSESRSIVGRVRASALHGSNNTHTDTDVVENASTTECSDGSEPPPFVSLGCHGELDIEFLDDVGHPIEITQGMQIFIGEFGKTCDDVQDEAYSFSLCTTPEPTDCPLVLVNSHTGSITLSL